MQYVEGETLAEKLRAGPLDPRDVITFATDVASALVAAHKRGIIHRDIKPQNIIITPERQAKLLDFGVARHHEVVATHESETTTILTTPGVIVGTPAFVSPEQAQQLQIDGRSDLFSLGAVLFECLTGKRAFTGRSSIDVLGAVLHHEPPLVSSLRPDLTPQYDELVARLLEKHPDDRFKSADELLGALRLITGTSRTHRESLPPKPIASRRTLLVTAAAVVLIGVAAGLWRWYPRELATTPEAAQWYRRGTEFIRDGAYHNGRRALNEAIKVDAQYAPSYVRLAEAETELDDAQNAQNALLKVNELVPSESRLPFDERMRYRAVRAMMLRDVDGGVRWYRELVERRSGDAGAWLDLGRAQDAAALTTDARISFEKAIQLDGEYAPPRLRRASILAFEGRREEALQAFAEAERLYRAAANVEGEIETLIRRGSFLNGIGELSQARLSLERAHDLAVTLQSRAQEIRAKLQLSTVTAAEGNWSAAEKMATEAVETALREDLETVAADGLIDLGTILIHQRKWSEADTVLLRAIPLAQQRGAQRVVERANLQRAYLKVEDGRHAEGIAAARSALEYVQANRYRRYELTALSIMSRAHEGLREYPEAKRLAQQALKIAAEIKDEVQAGYALESLAGAANALGALPEALEYRARGLEIHRRLDDVATLPFDLVNRADLLIRTGRHREAASLLEEMEAAIAKKLEAYLPRARRVRVLHALSAAIQHQPNEVERHARDFPPTDDGKTDSSSQLAALLLQCATVLRTNRFQQPLNASPVGSAASATGRELRYWDLVVRLANTDARSALTAAEETLASDGATVSYEFEWRVAAIGAAAARQVKDVERERVLRERAQRALARLRAEWKSDLAAYESRPDLTELRRKAGLN